MTTKLRSALSRAGISVTLAIVGLALLAGCDRQETASPPAATPSIQAAALTPGLYRTVQTGDVEDESRRCFTAAQIAKGSFVGADGIGEGWRATVDRMSGGAITVEGTGPADGRMTMKGRHDGKSYSVDSVLAFTAGGEAQRIAITQHGTFLSPDCTAKDDAESGGGIE